MRHAPHHRRTNRQGGYVLLLTLLLLAIVASAASGLARLSIGKATAANVAAEELQRHWGTVSCRVTFEGAAERVLADAERRSRNPVSASKHAVVLGTQQFDVIVTDEQAKVNVNSLLAQLNRVTAEQAVRRLASTSPDLKVELAPGKPSVTSANPAVPAKPLITAYEQLFAKTSPQSLLPETTPTSRGNDLTCWGDGRLHVRRASRAAVAEACAPLLNRAEAQRLLDLEAEDPNRALAAALDQLALNLEDRQAVSARLTDRSACHGVWVVCRGDRRAWYSFSVIADEEEREPQRAGDRRWYFEW